MPIILKDFQGLGTLQALVVLTRLHKTDRLRQFAIIIVPLVTLTSRSLLCYWLYSRNMQN
jgi:hypothetical protein